MFVYFQSIIIDSYQDKVSVSLWRTSTFLFIFSKFNTFRYIWFHFLIVSLGTKNTICFSVQIYITVLYSFINQAGLQNYQLYFTWKTTSMRRIDTWQTETICNSYKCFVNQEIIHHNKYPAIFLSLTVFLTVFVSERSTFK